jgi:predicted ester cyclase
MNLTAFPDMQVTIEDQLAEGDVVTCITSHGIHQGKFFGLSTC